MHTYDGTPSCFSAGPQPVQRVNVQFPFYGLPLGYTTLFVNATNEGPYVQQPALVLIAI